MLIMVCPIPRFFLRIARRGSAQVGAGLNSALPTTTGFGNTWGSWG